MKQTILNKLSFVSILFFISANLSFSQTQVQLNDAALADYKKTNAELNTVYQKILKEYKTDSVFVKNLKASQKLWIKFRDAELKVKYPDGQSYGSVKPMCVASYLEELTLGRIKTLKVWLDGIEEGDVCAGSVKTK